MTNLATIGVLLGAIPGAAGLLALYRAPGRLRNHLRHDAEMLTHLPNDSRAHQLLLDDIERRMHLLTGQPRVRRNWRGVIVSSLVVVLCLFFGFAGSLTLGWPGYLLIAEAIVGGVVYAVAAASNARNILRDATGTPVQA